ncbi:MAG: flap endonuclease-1 [Candidatus Diapherotrites archaeon]|nr:flap endonuclease-1 [Candidatus Diapherotrites archaeon]
MGVDFSDIVEKQKIELEFLTGRRIAFDAFNNIYQFLSIIRQADGTPLMDSTGKVTSHLSGLFYRTIKLVEIGIKPVFVFDGESPELKTKTKQQRREVRENSQKKWDEALSRGDTAEARKYAMGSSRLDSQMIDDSKKLLSLMGIPVVQAPSEGESQAAYLASTGKVWGVGSQDFDSLLFGAPILLRNVTITGRRKVPNKNIYKEIVPELINLSEVLSNLEITREQLVDIAILAGTDFNEGLYKVGPKTALKEIRSGKTAEQVFSERGVECEVEIDEVRDIFLNPVVDKDVSIKWGQVDIDGLVEFLCMEKDFSRERVEKAGGNLKVKMTDKTEQSRLNTWFG